MRRRGAQIFSFGMLLVPFAAAIAHPQQTPPPQPKSPQQQILGDPFNDGKEKQDLDNRRRLFGHDIVTCAILPLSAVQTLYPASSSITTPVPVGCTSGICGFSGNYVGCIHYSTQAIIRECRDYTSGSAANPCGTNYEKCGLATAVCNAGQPFCWTYIYDGKLTAFGCDSTKAPGPVGVQAVSITPFTPITGTLAQATATSEPQPTHTESLQERLHLPFSIGTLAGIAAGGFILLCAIGCLTCCWRTRSRRRAPQAFVPPPVMQQQQQSHGYTQQPQQPHQQPHPPYQQPYSPPPPHDYPPYQPPQSPPQAYGYAPPHGQPQYAQGPQYNGVTPASGYADPNQGEAQYKYNYHTSAQPAR